MDADETVQARLRELASAAFVRTTEGKMSWRTMEDEDAFLFSGSLTSLIIEYHSASNLREYVLKLSNPRGTEVDRLVGLPLAEDPWGATTPKPETLSDYDLLSKLHDAARRSALNVDGLLEAAFQDVLNSEQEDQDEEFTQHPTLPPWASSLEEPPS